MTVFYFPQPVYLGHLEVYKKERPLSSLFIRWFLWCQGTRGHFCGVISVGSSVWVFFLLTLLSSCTYAMCVWKKKDCQAFPLSKTADSSSLELSLCSTLDSQWCAYNNSRMSFCFLHVTRFSFYSKTCPSSASFVCEDTPFKGSDGGVPQSAGRQSRVLNQNLPLVYGLLGPSPLSIKQKPGCAVHGYKMLS